MRRLRVGSRVPRAAPTKMHPSQFRRLLFTTESTVLSGRGEMARGSCASAPRPALSPAQLPLRWTRWCERLRGRTRGVASRLRALPARFSPAGTRFGSSVSPRSCPSSPPARPQRPSSLSVLCTTNQTPFSERPFASPLRALAPGRPLEGQAGSSSAPAPTRRSTRFHCVM